ncbi:MAG: GNAT family N-acetyltransferase [bacterium]|nr:GNAT family N-acetyltransferase [Deltaproteobacteria bacterium]MCP4906859.1 GNAT family N-acetyltransferase [bacterium]
MERENDLGQRIGRAVEGWPRALRPDGTELLGVRCRLELLDVGRHAEALHAAYAENRDGGDWTYLPYGPFDSIDAYREQVRLFEASEDPFYVIIDLERGVPVGVAAYLRVFPDSGSIEVGHLSFAPVLQRTPTSTEAMYLMMKRVFDDWGYRRYEWKCDSLNGPSRAAAERLGFRYEGVFRNHLVMKGRNRDTAWFSITEDEWPDIRQAFEAWLSPANFDNEGFQRKRLGDLMPASAGAPIVRDT